MVLGVFILRRANIAMAPAEISASGAAQHPTVAAAFTAQPVGMRSEGGEPIFSHDVNCKLYFGLDDLNRKRQIWICLEEVTK